MIRLQILSGKQAGQVICVRRFPFRVGRNPEAELCLTEQGVWDNHCQIEYQPKAGFFLVPLPEAKTEVGDVLIEDRHRLANASEISLGAVRFRLSLDDPKPRHLGLREAVTWSFLIAVVIGEAWLIWWLPR